MLQLYIPKAALWKAPSCLLERHEGRWAAQRAEDHTQLKVSQSAEIKKTDTEVALFSLLSSQTIFSDSLGAKCQSYHTQAERKIPGNANYHHLFSLLRLHEVTDMQLFWVCTGLHQEQLVIKQAVIRRGKNFQGQHSDVQTFLEASSYPGQAGRQGRSCLALLLNTCISL